MIKNIRRVTYLTRRIFFILFVIVYPQCGNHCGKLSPFCTFLFLVLFLVQFIYVLFLLVFRRVYKLFFLLDLSVFFHIFICLYFCSFNAFLFVFLLISTFSTFLHHTTYTYTSLNKIYILYQAKNNILLSLTFNEKACII